MIGYYWDSEMTEKQSPSWDRTMNEENNTLRAIMQAFEIYPALKQLVKYKLNNEGIENVEITNETLRSTETNENSDVSGLGSGPSGPVSHETGAGNVRAGCTSTPDPIETKIEEVILSDFNKQ